MTDAKTPDATTADAKTPDSSPPGASPAELAAAFADWIGRRTVREDTITPRMLAHYRATLAGHLADEPVPPGLLWCLSPDSLPSAELGPDGHPRLGLYLPAIPYGRRMWAGGDLTIHGAFAAGDIVEKTSTIEDIAFKTGSTGPLCFVTVRHGYRVGGRLLVDERQDIVYREAGAKPAAERPARPAPLLRDGLTADPVLLFRYSALTFNGHRIHYDLPYATGVEGHDGLVVHGPLQATLMLNLAARAAGRPVKRFAYRGLSPLYGGQAFDVEADWKADGVLAVTVISETGATTMAGTAEV